MTNTFKKGDEITIDHRPGKFMVRYIDGPYVYYRGLNASSNANTLYENCTLVTAQPKFKPGDVVRNSSSTHTIKCVKTEWRFSGGVKYDGATAYDYTRDDGWDFESSLTLVRSNNHHFGFAAATAAPKVTPKFKVGDRVKYGKFDTVYTIKDIREDGHLYFTEYPRAGYCYPWPYEFFESSSPTIVVRRDPGKGYRPNDNPRVHNSVAEATKEAERLAKANPGVEFATFSLASTSTATAPTVTTVAA
jgi:hypothetical protein